MIKLFNIPNYTIDTSKFSNILHDEIVNIFTENFLNYIGAPYGCPINSATSAIFLLSKYGNIHFKIPTMLPPVVENAIRNGGSTYEFTDDVRWVGGQYNMNDLENDTVIIDSAQEVMQLNWTTQQTVIAIYSFYPTKPIGSCDGGMIVSNRENIIDFFRTIVYDGMTPAENSWDRQRSLPGWKMYMDSIQAYIANESLKKLGDKKHNIRIVRDIYNNEFGYQNDSDHLYRITVSDNHQFIKYAHTQGIQCGIHYKCLHKTLPHTWNRISNELSLSEFYEDKIVSLPLHEKLTSKEINEVIKCVKNSGMQERL